MLMFSVPPARTNSAWPSWISCAARRIAWRPEPQRRLTVSAGASFGTPDFRPMWRARYTASPEVCSTLPKMTWSMRRGSTFERSSAAFAAITPRSVAEVSRSAPPNAPNGVRAPSTMTMSFTSMLPAARGGPRAIVPLARWARTLERVDMRPAVQNHAVATILPRPGPLRTGIRALVEAKRLAGAGDPRGALGALEAAYADGCRYKKEWLTGDRDLATLGPLPGFADFVVRANARYEEAAAAARPRLTFVMPDTPPDAFGYPLLMVLHGNNSNAKETAPYWSHAADTGWVVAIPQSSEIGASPESYTWNDRERAARALAKRFTARGVVSIAAWLPRIDELRRLVEGGAGKMLRVYVIVGALDPSRDGARALVDLLAAHKIRARLDERAGLEHEYPDDMETTLPAALAFATA